ncbi:MAG: hypothetical protein WCJ86_04355, partial [Candidatus Saccharibacteria bacterium]
GSGFWFHDRGFESLIPSQIKAPICESSLGVLIWPVHGLGFEREQPWRLFPALGFSAMLKNCYERIYI